MLHIRGNASRFRGQGEAILSPVYPTGDVHVLVTSDIVLDSISALGNIAK